MTFTAIARAMMFIQKPSLIGKRVFMLNKSMLVIFQHL